MNSTDRLKKTLLDFIKIMERARKILSIRCNLYYDVVWYRQEKHIARRRWQRKRGMYG